MIKILITTYVAMASGHVSSNSIVVEAENRDEANKIMTNLQKEEKRSARVHYAAVVLN